MRSPTDTVAAYLDAWNTPDGDRRQGLLDRAWSGDGTYTDPTAHVAGRAALHAHIGGFARNFPGAHFVLTSAVDTHHDVLRFGWRLIGADGAELLEGVDFGEIAPDGRLRRIVGFFGPLPDPVEA